MTFRRFKTRLWIRSRCLEPVALGVLTGGLVVGLGFAFPDSASADVAKTGAKEVAKDAAKTAAPGAAPSSTPVSSLASGATSASPEIISVTRVVGEVGEHFLTSREVRISDAIDQALDKAGVKSARKILTGQEKTFPSEVGRALDEWVVYLEAKSFSSTPPAKSDVAAAIQTIQEVWVGKSAWSELEVGAEELRSMVERKVVARAFERLKGDAALVPISDDDALQYFKKNRLRFGSLPFTAFKDNIKAFLIKQQTERRLSEWHEVLRRKYKVRNFIAG